ncbi:hypothetical protein T484DRAFT_1874884 [Baffinella frigidus]|nr:hypothetical protein T484DRAFT_1874884 [Cryptophyta sp. CCMP2293]
MGEAAVEPGTQRRKKQRARLVPGGELSGKSEAEIPLDAARPEDGEAAPNKRPRVTEEAAPAHQRPLSGSAFDPVPNTNSNSGDEGDKDLQRHCCDELSPAAIQGSKAMAGVPVPIFVPVKTVSAQDILTGAHLRRSGNSSAPASDPSSTTSWVVRVGEKPKTAEEAGAWGPPRTNVFKRAPPPITFKGFTPPQQPANQSAPAATQRSSGAPSAWGAGTAAAALMGTNGAGAQRGGAWGTGAAPLQFSSVLAGGMFGMPKARPEAPSKAKGRASKAPAAKVSLARTLS